MEGQLGPTLWCPLVAPIDLRQELDRSTSHLPPLAYSEPTNYSWTRKRPSCHYLVVVAQPDFIGLQLYLVELEVSMANSVLIATIVLEFQPVLPLVQLAILLEEVLQLGIRPRQIRGLVPLLAVGRPHQFRQLFE